MPVNDNPDPRSIGLLLIDGFALMSYASIVEPFRAANSLTGKPLYAWTHISVDGTPVRASNGATILAAHKVGDAVDCDLLFVFAAGDPSTFADAPTFAWLRKLASAGVAIGGVSGGPFLLARAGLLDGHRATIHWEHATALREAFPRLDVEPGLFVIDCRRMTCAGGTAGIDLAIELIERDHGAALARAVGDWFILSQTRAATQPQRLRLRDRFGVSNDALLRVLAAMEARIEEPASRDALAAIAGVSLRQLERLFARHLGASLTAIYLQIRLDAAAQMLRSTALRATDVAVACGFRSHSHFSRSYKARFGHSPSLR